MTRKKVKLVWIVNDGARKASLKKRRIGLLKKVSELTILCGVSAFAVIYSPGEAEPMVWPSKPVVQQMFIRYQNIPEIDKCKKMVNQESYLKERMGKFYEHSKKNQKKNRDSEMSYLMDRLHNERNGIDEFVLSEMQILIWLLEERMRDIRKRVDYFQQVPPLLPLGHNFASLPPPQPQGVGHINMEVMGGGGSGDADHIIRNNNNNNNNNNNSTDAMMWDQWFVDMINNTENIAAGSSVGGTRNDMGSLPLHAYNFPAGYSGVDHMGPHALEFNLPNFTVASSNDYSGENATFDMRLPPPMPPMGENPFGLGLSYETIAGDVANTATIALGLGLPPTNNAGSDLAGSSMGLPEFFGGGGDTGLPYDFSRGWPHNFSP
ncbi:agamous-like MADS-box protein AGL80 [Mercurialis annua]|uniref:agamous-like MADS-box protein AGL80 n=1 Tax=Mercurialis annua TaxID=3986 RepID=UPI00215F3F92|nr:agamous-like MADS-box protein AGL80 [Mercurialis annua]